MATQPNQKPLRRGALPAADRARLAEAHRLMQQSRLAEAEPLLREALKRHPASFDALHSLGVFAVHLERHADAVALFREALKSDPDQADALFNLGKSLRQTGELDPALACIDMALALNPQDDGARLEGARWLVENGRIVEAGRLVEPMQLEVASSPKGASRAGLAALALDDLTGAARWFELAVAGMSGDVEAHIHLGETLAKLDRMSDAEQAFAQALLRDGSSSRAHYGRGHALLSLGQRVEALEAAGKALVAEPGLADAWNLQGAVQMSLQRLEPACESFRQALSLDPKHRVAIRNFATALHAMRRYDDAALVCERLLAVWPECEFTKGKLMHCKMMTCDWLNYDMLLADIERDVDAGSAAAEPFGMQAYCTSPARLQLGARIYARSLHPDRSAAHSGKPWAAHAKIRIGYVSGEFRQQATSILLVRLLELHDRDRFDVYAFDSGRADQSAYRRRVEQAVVEVIHIADLSDEQACAAIREREIDILVNLNGYFGGARTDLFSRRPASIQVNYLGFPGTIGATYMDYIVGDRFVVPEDHRAFYDEAVVDLPDSYQPNDDRRAQPEVDVHRHDHGLPESGFVFCCFNNSYKITPDVFSVWMQLLTRVPGSVLWLLRFKHGEVAQQNLVAEAQWHGIDASRLVFAPFVDVEEHLSRLRLADLVLDTLPYNAHTTGSDALWVGVPVVTCMGNTFPGRVGASLLNAAGLPGLITQSLPEYEALAYRLATSPDELATARAHLVRQRATMALFDSDRYRRHLESAYEEMHRRAEQGIAPSAIAVQAFEPLAIPVWNLNDRTHHEQVEAHAV